jgi:hypothetical protein
MLCWEVQEGVGTRIKDSAGSPFSIDAAMSGTMAWVEGQKPRALMSTRESSNTFVDTGQHMASFGGGSIITATDASQFNFAAKTPFIMGITIAAAVIRPTGHSAIVGNGAVGEGWVFYLDQSGHFVFLETGVEAHDFSGGDAKSCCLEDLNPHRVLFARNATKMYLFVDGKLFGDTTETVGNINVGSNQLTIGEDLTGVGADWPGKANRLAIYNYPWKDFTDISAFANNEYLYWQGMDNGFGVGE